MKTKSPLAIVLSLLIPALAIVAVLPAPRQAAARQTVPTPRPSGVRLLATAGVPATASQRMIYAETAPDGITSTIYLTDPAAVEHKQALAEVTHRQGYPPQAQVSPDARSLAILAVPPGASELDARTAGGEIWLLATDGSAARRLTGGAAQLAGWSPGGAWLAYSRLEAIPNPPEPQIPFRTEVYRLSADGQQNTLIFSNAVDYGVQPLGWLPDGAYLTALLDMRGSWRLAAFSEGVQMRAWNLPGFDLVRGMWLSPTGAQVLIEAVLGGADELLVFNLSENRLQAQPPLAAALFSNTQPVSPVQGVWSDRGRLWILQRGQTAGQPRSETTGPDLPPAQPRLELDQDEVLLAESWSPDEDWFVYRRYPQIYASAFLQQRDSSKLIELRPALGNWLTLYGWLPAGGKP